jgi:hypothetical protein
MQPRAVILPHPARVLDDIQLTADIFFDSIDSNTRRRSMLSLQPDRSSSLD